MPIEDIFKQIFVWFFDGTSRHLSYFDELAKDKGYAGTIEQAPEHMTSSHAIKLGQPDAIYLCFAREHGVVLITKNPSDFYGLHSQLPDHSGILAIYQDNDPKKI